MNRRRHKQSSCSLWCELWAGLLQVCRSHLLSHSFVSLRCRRFTYLSFELCISLTTICFIWLLLAEVGIMNFNNVKVPKMPSGGGAASALIKVGLIGGLGLYAAANSLYNVEGGHRAIVFNRLVGVKDKVLILPLFHIKVSARILLKDCKLAALQHFIEFILTCKRICCLFSSWRL